MPKPLKILRPDEVEALHTDIRERLRLRTILAENSCEVLELELGVSVTTIRRIEKPGYETSRLTLISMELLAEVARRRKAYWLAREVYEDKYSTGQLMERYGISRRTLWNHVRAVKNQRLADARRVAA